MSRYGIGLLVNPLHAHFPYATLVSNVLSSFLLGVLLAFSWREGGLADPWKWLLMTGFCGGFSTFSTFTGETFYLFQSGHYSAAFLNIAGNLVVCLVALYLGVRAAG